LPHAIRVALAAAVRLRAVVRPALGLGRLLVVGRAVLVVAAIVSLAARFAPRPQPATRIRVSAPPLTRSAAAPRTTRGERLRARAASVARSLTTTPLEERIRHVLAHPGAVPSGIASLVIVAALVGVAPNVAGHVPAPDLAAANGSPRIAAFGGPLRGAAPNPAIGGTRGIGRTEPDPTTGLEAQVRQERSLAVSLGTQPIDVAYDSVGPFAADGLRFALVPVAPDARLRMRDYTVRAGDTLASVAKRFHLQPETIWWANALPSVAKLPVGVVIAIPPVDGLMVVVKAGDTLAAIAARTKVDAAAIVADNGLPTSELAEGQVLFVPGAAEPALPKAAPKPAPKPAPKAAAKPVPKPASQPTVSISSGWVFPVVGGGAYISQYFHASHPALDIAADYGTPVRAAHAGVVTFAGWKNNGGGWQVWISHGGGLFTTYAHMSALTVSTGQRVGAGQQVGFVGQTGWATGPHCHFEVWRGPIWDGGVRLNPLNYV